ncbi:MAG TPA: oxidoreductase [Desulfurococcaceae archaeon]|nr:oxidoreductase [Desulfurococcaceae archaeon]
MKKLRIAVYKFASCDGCQLQLLNLEEELLDLVKYVEFAMFYEATSDNKPGPYDAAFIEGAVSTPHEEEIVKEARREAEIVVAIGACATAGGIQALRNWASVEEYKKYVYPNPEWIEVLEKARPISDYIKVDYEIRGCPVSKYQLSYFIRQLLIGKRPTLPSDSVCMECKMKGNVCLMVTRDIPCLGPVTMAGCGALCPSFGRGCYGCYGPMIDPKPKALAQALLEKGLSKKDVTLLFKSFTGWSKQFREVVDKYGR